jgi:DNA polymerase III alpha subunit
MVHLHVHSHYSLLDGLASPIELANRAIELGMPAIALTDHGNMYGAIDFYTSCKERGIKPIIGYEAYVAPNSRFDKNSKKGDITNYHLTLLAKNIEGYYNLIQLSTKAFTEGFYYKPRIDMELLKQHHAGIICLSGCLYSCFSQTILNKPAETYIVSMQNIFEEDFYIEVQDHGIPEQRQIINIIKDSDLPIVATNDVHYLRQEDAKAHDALLCIGTHTTIYDTKRLRFPSDQLYMKSKEEMCKLFPWGWVDTTVDIADKCNLEIPLHKTVHIHNPEAAFLKLKEICDGRIEGYNESHKKRYETELEAIQKTGYAEYLLVVCDFIKFCIHNDIAVGSGRGSSAGSLVCYLLGITNIDPLNYGLLFERFINSERVEPPDIDVDISQARRKEVIEYLKNEYGHDQVSQIIAFGSMKTKLVIKDVCRVLEIDYTVGNNICKAIKEPFEGTIDDVFNTYETDPKVSVGMDTVIADELYAISKKIEGKLRTSSTHAAGIVISNMPLTDVTPLCIHKNTGLTQYDMYAIEKLGLLKFDILGLRTIDVIHDTCKYLGIQPQNIPLNDGHTYNQIRNGETFGVFQYEGWGYTKFIKKMQPQNFEHLIALGALYRPGPLNCISGDTHIQYSLSSGVKKYRTIKEWYDQIQKNKQNIKQMKIISIDEKLGISQNNGILDIIYTGKQDVYSISVLKNCPNWHNKDTKSRFQTIRCTKEHMFLCVDDNNTPIYKRAKELKHGDYIAIKYWNNTAIANIKRRNQDFTSVAFFSYRCKCAICGWDITTPDVHHIDGDNKNNITSNLIYLCPNHHREVEFTRHINIDELNMAQYKNKLPNTLHKHIRYVPYFSTNYIGNEDTYDIQCSNIPHNFIANGFVVHNSGMADEYVEAMHRGSFSSLEEITADTYGILLYQEQVMRIVVAYAGFTMNEADTLRKAIGKKDKELMDSILHTLADKLAEKGYSQDFISDLINKIVKFARYGWNKAHAVSYAILSYQTAYLKFNHSTEFFCALLNSELDDHDRVSQIMQEAIRWGVKIVPPQINISDVRFKLYDGKVYGGLLAIKGIGEKTCEAILKDRIANGIFKDPADLRKRIPPKNLNSTAMKILIESKCIEGKTI